MNSSTPEGSSTPSARGALPTTNTDALAAVGHGLDPNSTPTRGKTVAWALWDWGSASFNAVVTTFVFSTYLASTVFIDPAIVEAAAGDERDPARVAALAGAASVVALWLTIAGFVIAAIAPVLGQRSDGSGRRKFWLAINTGVVILAMLAMFFVEPAPSYLVLGAILLAVGNIFFEFASVNYNAMLAQVSTPANVGRVSGFGWGLGYIGGIVLLILLLALFIGDTLGIPAGGLLGLPTSVEGGVLSVRVAIVVSAVWFLVFAIPVLLAVPEIPARDRENRVGFLASYAKLWHTVRGLAKDQPNALRFLVASAIFRDGLAGVFTFGAIIAAQAFGFSFGEVLTFGVAANVVAGLGTFAGGYLDDRFGPKVVIIGSLIGMCLAGLGIFIVGSGQGAFWILGLSLTLFVGPVQAASRSFLARITPVGREGEIFGLYATTGRAVSFLTPALFGAVVALTGTVVPGILAIVGVLLVGVVLMLWVKNDQNVIN